MQYRYAAYFFLILISGFAFSAQEKPENWIPIFNGKNLDGWTPKIAGRPLGENYKNTFVVEDGILKVNYNEYEKFDNQFGHLYTNQSYSHYRLTLEYRFTGDVLPDAPSWTKLNSGVMLHSQSPTSLKMDQHFPVSLEAQFLAKGTSAGTQTGNLCTPGTHVYHNGKLSKDHILDSKSILHPASQWIRFEAEVRGNEEIRYKINGKEVFRFSKPMLDKEDQDALFLINNGASISVSHGHIALQAEAQPVWFRKIYIQPL